MAKAPVPGRVKTRLCPPLSLDAAAAVAEAALADTLAAVAGCGAEEKIVALEGRPGAWLPEGFRIVPQAGRGLDQRLAHAWAATAPLTGGMGVQIGMDTPQVTAAELDSLLTLVASQPRTSVLGPARDGGWWAIGLRGTDPRRVFTGVPMSSARTCAVQAHRLSALGLTVRMVHDHRDIDTVADLAAVATTIPRSATAGAWHRFNRSAAVAS
jgi:hypothetical protein